MSKKSSEEEMAVDIDDCDNPVCPKLTEDLLDLYQKNCENLGDVKIGVKADTTVSGGLLGRLYDMPGKTWFTKYRPQETTTVMTDAEWKKLYGPWRHYTSFFLLWGPPGNLFYNIRVPMTFVFVITLANAIYATVSQFHDLPHWFALGNPTSYSMTSFLVSLLLGFKINRSFDRWALAKQNFTYVCSRVSGILTSVTLAKLDDHSEKQNKIILRMQNLLLAYPYTIIMAVYSLDRCPSQVVDILEQEDIEMIENTEDAWHLVLCELEILLHQLLSKKGNEITKEINQARVESSSLLAIKRSNFPYFLSRIPTALLMIYTFTVPMELYAVIMDNIHDTDSLRDQVAKNLLHYWYLASLILVFAALILAANEGADLLQDPFYYIPMHSIAGKELKNAARLIRLADIDFKKDAERHANLGQWHGDEKAKQWFSNHDFF